MTYKAPYTLTKMDVAALRQADTICVHYQSETDTRVRAIKRIQPTEANPFAQDVEVLIGAPVTVQYQYDRDATRAQCFGYVSLYKSQRCHASSVIATLRAGDAIRFDFYPDGHTSPALEEVGFHADFMRIIVYRNDKEFAQFELVSCITQGNSARMCKGVYRIERVKS